MSDTDTHTIEVEGYRLVRAIGSGDVTTVYVAVQRSLEREVAVKVFDAMSEDAVARFEQLLRANAQLSHPNIVGIHQIGRTADGRLFHSMPLLQSAALSRHNLSHRPLKVATVVRELLEALGYAHRCGVVHGDINPSNVLFDQQGRTRLADFGIARCAAETGSQHPRAKTYMSPEQVRGNPPEPRSDLYSIGVLAFEFLSGSLPFEDNRTASTRAAQAEQPVPRLPRIAGAWQPWIDKALASSPERRFRNAREMADALAAIDGKYASENQAAPVTSVHLPRWTAVAAGLIMMVALTLAGWTAWGQHQASGPLHSHPVAIAKTAPAPVPPPSQPVAPAESSSVISIAERVGALIAQADALRAGGHLFSPSGDNAVDNYLAALKLDPGNRAAVNGIDAILGKLRPRLDAAWHGDRVTPALGMLKQCDLLATHAGRTARRSWHAQRDGLAREVGTAVKQAGGARNIKRLASLKPLADALPAIYPAGFDFAAAERLAATPSAGDRLRDRGGPVLVYVAAAGSAPAFAIARVDVTRADYATFTHATGRSASRCLEAYNPFSRLQRLNWRSPGFAQASNHPAVCVSWNDGAAYAAWLSKTTGETYRLPTAQEWLRAAQGIPKGDPCQLGNVDDASRHSVMDNDRWHCDDGAAQTAPVGRYAPSGVGAYGMYGNVSDWVAGGSAQARTFRGLSWRDGSRQTPLGRKGTADTDVGYTNVGFRLVRVIDPAHPTPPRVDAGY